MDFIKYQHIERLGSDEVDGIQLGVCYVFAKIDGTNGSVWIRDGVLQFGSRNRDLDGEGNDNQGFKTAIEGDPRIMVYLTAHPTHRLYGEWLVPHSLKTYREDAWRKFYVFDVCVDVEGANDEGPAEKGEGLIYLSYDVYQPLLEAAGLDYIPLLAQVRNGSGDQFFNLLEQNQFLVKDGQGVGEGIVIKNYDFKNKYGRVTWAKIVRSEFKDINHKTMGAPIIRGEDMVEEKIAARYCTDALVEKEYAKIVAENGGWSSKLIPQLLGKAFHCVVTENTWDIVRDFKMPRVDFKLLNRLVIERVKQAKKEVFA